MEIISDDRVRALITMDDAVAAMRRAFTAAGAADAPMQARVRTAHPDTSLSTMGAILPGLGVCGAKVYATREGQFDFVIPLFSTHDGQLLCVVRGNALTQFRTAAVTRIVADALALPEAREMALFGTGVQALAHAQVMLAHSRIARLSVVGLGDVTGFLAQLRQQFPQVEMAACEPRQALEHADVVVTATRSTTPLFEGAWLKPGAFVAAIGSSKPSARELDDATLRRARGIVVEWREQARVEAGDLLLAAPGLVDWQDVLEIGELLAGKRWDQRSGDVTVYKSIGVGLSDVALAERVYRQHCAQQG